MITFKDKIERHYSVEDYMFAAKNKNIKDLIDKPLEKFLLKYFSGSFDNFMKIRKEELYSGKRFSSLRKFLATSEALAFKKDSYQYKALIYLFDNTGRFIRISKPNLVTCDDSEHVDWAAGYFIHDIHMINDKTYDIIRKTWIPYIEYLKNNSKKSDQYRLQKNIEAF